MTNVFDQPYREYKLSNIDPLTGKERRKPRLRTRAPKSEEPPRKQKPATPPPSPVVTPAPSEREETPPPPSPTPVNHKTPHPKVIDELLMLRLVW